MRRYGISAEEFARLLVEQSGRCGICSRPMTDDLRIDHDHETGIVRGLLCHRCNHGLAFFGDGAAGVRAALAYLEH